MRIVAGKTDPKIGRYRVFLNGDEAARWCLEANDTAGYVVLHKCNAEGKPMLDEQGEAITETRWGTVVIEAPE
jgi:hypothetical protein